MALAKARSLAGSAGREAGLTREQRPTAHSRCSLDSMYPLALVTAGGLLAAIVGFVLYGIAGGVESGFLGNEKLGDAGGTLLVAGTLLFVGGLVGLFVVALIGTRSDRSEQPRDPDWYRTSARSTERSS